jgi:hypothetical protein
MRALSRGRLMKSDQRQRVLRVTNPVVWHTVDSAGWTWQSGDSKYRDDRPNFVTVEFKGRSVNRIARG